VGRLAARGRAERRGLPARGELTAAFRALRGPMNRHRLSHPRPRDPAASHANRQQSIQTAGRAPTHRGAPAAGVLDRRPAVGSRQRPRREDTTHPTPPGNIRVRLNHRGHRAKELRSEVVLRSNPDAIADFPR
jgi:hypothetical protein